MLAKSLYEVDFHELTYGSYGPDESAYTLDNTRTTFRCTMFGQLRILAAPTTADHDNNHRSASIWIIYLLPDAGSGCRTKMVLVETRPACRGRFSNAIGDLVLFEASLHRWDERSGTTLRVTHCIRSSSPTSRRPRSGDEDESSGSVSCCTQRQWQGKQKKEKDGGINTVFN
ncbi:hypothetical protein B0H17DRAFT_1139578 [Mycena rosella]|uniref:Uncharacterized protein n=1 Tax=Mycena rosella TaxID=1033263 RepID=A0AAD7D7M7_MYCRO|nr:hypothetical protein B0H17DRAFT_1139578 [Mycena rosella]